MNRLKKFTPKRKKQETKVKKAHYCSYHLRNRLENQAAAATVENPTVDDILIQEETTDDSPETSPEATTSQSGTVNSEEETHDYLIEDDYINSSEEDSSVDSEATETPFEVNMEEILRNMAESQRSMQEQQLQVQQQMQEAQQQMQEARIEAQRQVQENRAETQQQMQDMFKLVMDKTAGDHQAMREDQCQLLQHLRDAAHRNEGQHRKKQSYPLPKFSGESSERNVTEFIERFERITEHYGWEDEERLQGLQLQLEGPAGAWLKDIPTSEKNTYETLVKNLKKRYDSPLT